MFDNENPIMPLADDGDTGGSFPTATVLEVPVVDQRDYGDSFCLASCYLAIANYYGANITMEKLIQDRIVSSSGYVNWWGDYVTKGSNITFDASNVDRIKLALTKGTPVIITGRSNSYEHHVVAYGFYGDTIKVMDPWGGVTGNLLSTTLVSANNYKICTPGSKIK